METQEWNEQNLPKVPPGYSGGRLPGRSTKERGGEEKEKGEKEEKGQRNIRYENAQKVVASIKGKAAVHEDARSTAQRTVRQSVKQSSDCAQIENGEERKKKYGKKKTRWNLNGRKMRSWRKFWSKEGQNDTPCRRRSSKRHWS